MNVVVYGFNEHDFVKKLAVISEKQVHMTNDAVSETKPGDLLEISEVGHSVSFELIAPQMAKFDRLVVVVSKD